MAGLIDIIKSDIEQITSDSSEFGTALHFTSPDGLQEVDVYGLYAKHHIQIDPESGRQINVKNAHCSVSEKFFIDGGYQVRNTASEVLLKGHKVRATDVSGLTWNYVVQESHMDETVGLVRIILGDFSQ